jgi:hypothetical protein
MDKHHKAERRRHLFFNGSGSGIQCVGPCTSSPVARSNHLPTPMVHSPGAASRRRRALKPWAGSLREMQSCDARMVTQRYSQGDGHAHSRQVESLREEKFPWVM